MIVEKITLVLGGLMLLALFVLTPWMIYDSWKQSQSPTFELYKNEWVCTSQETRSTTTYTLAGKVMIPITTESDYCVQWTEKDN